eukprot:Skav229394  [mRNA]  locus=scaffold904:62739:70484:+ [translate_table: standard]
MMIAQFQLALLPRSCNKARQSEDFSVPGVEVMMQPYENICQSNVSSWITTIIALTAMMDGILLQRRVMNLEPSNISRRLPHVMAWTFLHFIMSQLKQLAGILIIFPTITPLMRILIMELMLLLIQALFRILDVWLADTRTRPQDANPTALFVAYFLHGDYQGRCDRPRRIRLGDNTLDWFTRIHDLRRDMFDHLEDMAYHLVKPQPPQDVDDVVAGHILVIQKPSTSVAIQMSVKVFDDPWVHSATLTRAPPTWYSLVLLSQQGPFCFRPHSRDQCHVQAGSSLIQRNAHWQVWTGLLGRSPAHTSTRMLVLGPETQDWEAEVRRLWHDVANPLEPIHAIIIAPRPRSAVYRPSSVHVLLEQGNHGPDLRSGILLSFQEGWITDFVAVSTTYWLTPGALLWYANLLDLCGPGPRDHRCTFWIGEGDQEIAPQQRFVPDLGMHLHIRVEPRSAEAVVALSDSNDVTSSIQLSISRHLALSERQTDEAVAHAQRPEVETCPVDRGSVTVDFRAVVRAYEVFDAHLCLPQFHFPDTSGLLPASIDWIQLPWFDYTQLATHLHIHFDGSFDEEKQAAGYAAAAFALVDHQWHFAGCLGSALLECPDSYSAEVYAALAACKFAFDLCKLQCSVHPFAPYVHFVFDALTVGQQMMGVWQASQQPQLVAVTRGIWLLCETRFGTTLTGEHTHSHSHRGEPGNELVDQLANRASQFAFETGMQTWHDLLALPAFTGLAAWFWVLHDASFSALLDQGFINLPAAATTQPTVEVLPKACVPDAEDNDALHCELQQRDKLQALAASLNVAIDSVIWADDVAVPWCTRDASSLVAELLQLMQFLHNLFLHRGFELNYAPGKTNILLSFQGPQASALRKLHLITPSPGGSFLDAQGHDIWEDLAWLHAVDSTILPQGWEADLTPLLDYVAMPADKQFQGLARRDALQIEGPRYEGPTVRDQQLHAIQLQIGELEMQLCDLPKPLGHAVLQPRIFARLTDAVLAWFESFQAAGFDVQCEPDLLDRWLDVLQMHDAIYHEWAAMLFTQRGQDVMPDVLTQLVDGEAEKHIEESFAELVAQFDSTQAQLDLDRLRARLRGLQADAGPFPHRAPYGPVATAKPRRTGACPVRRAYAEQVTWQSEVRAMEWFDSPEVQFTPLFSQPSQPKCFLVVRLFSGRRRIKDLHWHLSDFAPTKGYCITVLSFDTYLRKSPVHVRLSAKDLGQLDQSSQFFLQCVLVLTWRIRCGGSFVFEHLAPPHDTDKASVWTSSIVQLLLRLPGLHLRIVEQWRWGSTVCKPTGLLVWQLPRFIADIYAMQLSDVSRPTVQAIGRSECGTFHTSAHKECPPQFCRAIAHAVTAQFSRDLQAGVFRHSLGDAAPTGPAFDWLVDMTQLSAVIRSGTQWLPDYQG